MDNNTKYALCPDSDFTGIGRRLTLNMEYILDLSGVDCIYLSFVFLRLGD